jgi:NAD(P)H-hydrate epimerase
MPRLPQALYSAAQSRTLDQLALAAMGLSGNALMERAGTAAFSCLRRRWPRAQRLAIVCGPGNNGGDGYVLARLAQAAGRTVAAMTIAGTPAPRGDAATAHTAFMAAGGRTELVAEAGLHEADVIIDALVGTGLERALTGPWQSAVEAINAAGRPVLALDMPSGVHSDTGRVLGCAVRAQATVTFIGLKLGLFTGAGPAYAGEVSFDDLGVPAACCAQVTPLAARITRAMLRGLLPRRARDAHKGQLGRVLVVGGDAPMGGAPRLAGVGAYRAGAGLVTLAMHPVHASAVGAHPELISYGVADAAGVADALGALLSAADVIAVGPGLGQGAWGQALWAQVRDSAQPLVVDADALNLLATEPQRREDWVLTPHPGEAARLLGCTAAEVQADRPAAARALVARYGGVCVLKGAGTLIADAGGLWLCDRGNPGMATAGMGDVLTGIIAALRAQGLSAHDAARLGVWVHAAAGDDAARDGEIGTMASDIFLHIRDWLNRLSGDATATAGEDDR